MLSRTASDLYWMSRYLERAENLARMLDVSYLLSLMPHSEGSDGLEELAMPLLITGSMDHYQERHGDLHADRILDFFALDPDNPSSIYNCMVHARRNAHAVRGKITGEMWENVNAAWLDMLAISEQGIARYGISRFCEWVKERSHLFRGATFGTIVRSDAYRFIRIGTFIERADNTLRLLDARYELLGEHIDDVDDRSARAYYQWSALLRALSSFEAFAEIYRGSPRAHKVAELLLLRADVPRSLRSCLDELQQILASLPGDNGRPAQGRVAELHARLRYTAIEDVLDTGLHSWITEYIGQLGLLGNAIHTAYLEVA